MNNEPVAWIAKTYYPNGLFEEDLVWSKVDENSIPLYTHPVKEQDGCGNCHACLVGVTENGYPVTMQRMILCPDCGNKRCPKASNHRYQCTESNEPNQRGSIYTHPVKEHFEDEPQAEELHEIMQSNTHPVEEQDESFDRTASHMAGEYVSYKPELTDEVKDALMDALLGWKYIRECHGDLYGVGWDRVQDKLEAILLKAQE